MTERPLHILGINCFKHDAAACLLRDGVVIAAAEEERFVRQKHTGRFPENAIRFCLNQGGISPEDLSHVAYYMVPSLALTALLASSVPRAILPGARGAVQRNFLRHQLPAVINFFRIPTLLAGTFPGKKLHQIQYHYVPHHVAHAASTFCASSFDDSVVLTLDGVGERASGGVFFADRTGLRRIRQWVVPHSLGLYYRAVTAYLGFATVFDEFKVMGLSAYGSPTRLPELLKMIRFRPNGTFRIDPRFFDFMGEFRGNMVTAAFENALGPARTKHEPLTGEHENIASSLQRSLEEVVLAIVHNLPAGLHSENLCFAGGVAMNSCLNGRLAKESGFKRFHVQPVSYDAGTSLGAAAYVDRYVLGKDRRVPVMDHLFLGPASSDRELEDFLNVSKVGFTRPQDLCHEVARLLTAGNIVGWFQGRMEFGARALGHRSILADPRKAENKDLLNRCVKHREPFRPFAPAVKEEKAGEYFELDSPSPYMARVVNVRPAARSLIPAVTHVDGTARVQTVNRAIDPLLWDLLDRLEKTTGIPVVLNTSFNIQGEPIVCTPREAMACYFTTGIDALALGPFLLIKNREESTS
jgi:carbamoyltransferase